MDNIDNLSEQNGQGNNHPDLSVLGKLPIMAWGFPKILLYIPIERSVPGQAFNAILHIIRQAPAILTMPYGRTDVSRNKAADKLLESDFDYLCMLDVDHIHPKNILQNLAKWVILDPERLVVGGLNFSRGKPWFPCAFRKGDDGEFYHLLEWEKGLIEVDAIGTGCIMISRQVFERIDPPWFFYDYSDAADGYYPSEDLAFSKKCQEAGIRLWCDTETTSPHLIDSVVDERTYKVYLEDNPEEIDYVLEV